MKTFNYNGTEIPVISNEEYCTLNKPKFIGQTRRQSDGSVVIVWDDNGKLFATRVY